MPSSIRRDIGQLLIGSLPATTITTELRALAKEFSLGGVILFARNIEAPEQVAEMSHETVQSGSAASQHTSPDDCQTVCSCDCLQHASLAMLDLMPPTPERLNVPSTRRIPAGHAAPALANLIRPPIG